MSAVIAETEMAQFRADAESRMTSRATIRRATGATVQNETTGREVPVWTVTHVGLPFRLAGTTSGLVAPSRTIRTGGAEVEVAVRTGHMPATTANVRDGDLIEITLGESAGSVWRVIEADPQDQATARRVPIVATTRPEEWV